MNPTPETYLEEFRSFPRYLPGGDEYRGGELPHELADGVFSVDRRTEAGWCVFSGISSVLLGVFRWLSIKLRFALVVWWCYC